MCIGWLDEVKKGTKVVSTTSCAPPDCGISIAMTSILLSSCRWMGSRLRWSGCWWLPWPGLPDKLWLLLSRFCSHAVAGVVMWSGGCASVSKMTVFEALNSKPVLSSVIIKASRNDVAPWVVPLKIRMSSTNRRSSKVDIHHGNPSPIRNFVFSHLLTRAGSGGSCFTGQFPGIPSLRPMHATLIFVPSSSRALVHGVWMEHWCK